MKVTSDSAVVEYDGIEYVLSKLARHVLYCVEDGRNPSSKYTQVEVDNAVNVLSELGLVIIDPENDREYLSEKGEVVVKLLRERRD